MRRDFTNQHGYFCPTENMAIKNANKNSKESVIVKKPKRKAKGPSQTPPKQTDENLKKTRQLYSALCCIAGMMDCTIEDITIKAKGDSDRYKTVGEKRVIERVAK
jgi:hypothetical protein